MLREYMDAAAQMPSFQDEGATAQRQPLASLSLIVGGGQRAWPGGSLPGGVLALMATIERLEQIIDQETRELKQNKAVDLRDFNHRKSQGLLELTRSMRGLGSAGIGKGVQAGLARLRGKLDANLSLLRLHLTAAQEVAALISRVIQDEESDGTYSSSVDAGR